MNSQRSGPELTGIVLCCSLRDQCCYQHHDHKQAPHLAPHYSYGRRICTVEKRNAVCQTQVVYSIEPFYTAIHHRLTQLQQCNTYAPVQTSQLSAFLVCSRSKVMVIYAYRCLPSSPDLLSPI